MWALLMSKLFIMSLDEDMPESWDTMPTNSTCVSVPITAGTPEYNDVQSLFRATCPKTITKVDHIHCVQ